MYSYYCVDCKDYCKVKVMLYRIVYFGIRSVIQPNRSTNRIRIVSNIVIRILNLCLVQMQCNAWHSHSQSRVCTVVHCAVLEAIS